MTTPNRARTPTRHQPPTVLVLDDIEAHYRTGRTMALELVSRPGFVKTVVPSNPRYPAAAVAAYDLAAAPEGAVADLANVVAPAPVIVTPPAPGRPGPKPGAGRKVA